MTLSELMPCFEIELNSRPNKDNPLMDIAAGQGVPVPVLDVWEHMYYLKFQNSRSDDLNSRWSIVIWTKVNRRSAKSRR